MDVKRENRILRAAVILLCAVQLVAAAAGAQGQRLPGPGTGVVDVRLMNDARVNAAQYGEWRVSQHGNWRVALDGAVAAAPLLPPFVAVDSPIAVRWGSGGEWQPLTVRETHPSGWVRVAEPGVTRTRWVNLAHAAQVELR